MAGMPTWTILGGGYQSYLKGDYQAAFDEWLPLAELGDVEAQYNLGVMYDEGTGVEQDFGKAAEWYRKAAERGFLEAQYNLGMMYYHGQGVLRDHEEAARWLQLAADHGDSEAAKILQRIRKQATSAPSTASA